VIKLAVFDVDRTLVPPELGMVAPETATALKQLQAKGIKTAIASGRLYTFLQQEILDLGFDYYIMSNGTYVVDHDGHLLEQITLEPEVVEAFSAEMIRRGHPFNIRYCMGHITGNPNITVFERMQSIWAKQPFKMKPPKAMMEEYVPADGELPVSLAGYIPEEEQEAFVKLFPKLEFLSVFEGPLCDINPAGVSKATGIETTCRLLGIGMKETIAFGDDRNDLEMIEKAGIGVAMDNGIQAVKIKADYITAPSSQLGVVSGLRHFGLID